jgi:hypothetical protein
LEGNDSIDLIETLGTPLNIFECEWEKTKPSLEKKAPKITHICICESIQYTSLSVERQSNDCDGGTLAPRSGEASIITRSLHFGIALSSLRCFPFTSALPAFRLLACNHITTYKQEEYELGGYWWPGGQ